MPTSPKGGRCPFHLGRYAPAPGVGAQRIAIRAHFPFH